MTNSDDPERFDRARRLGGLTVQQLWLRYLALGGVGDVFDVDAFLQGLAPLDPMQRDVLACAVNERLLEVFDAVWLPYLSPQLRPPEPTEDLVRALSRLLDQDPRQPSDQGPEQEDNTG